MEQAQILKNVIESLSNYYKKQKSFNRIFSNEPVMSKAIEVFDAEMNEMVDHVFDLIGIPSEESNDKYDTKNWTRDVCTNLIKISAKKEKYIEPAVELITDWKSLADYTEKVETSTWFNYSQLLDEHLTVYKQWHQEQCDKDKSKGRSKTV